MNTLARELGITCTADIGLLSIEYTCIDGGNCYTESLCLFNTGVNTSNFIEWNCLLTNFPKTARRCLEMNFIHYLIRFMKFMDFTLRHSLVWLQLLHAVHFTFLLGGGPIEMFCAFLGAGAGNFLRAKMNQHHLTLFLCTAASVALACIVYTIASWH